MASGRSEDPLVWIDCEMTGLNRSTDAIMSICCYITDPHLTLLHTSPFEAVIHHAPSRLSLMDDWCARTHANSGLTAACIASTIAASAAAADLLAYIQRLVPSPRRALLAGNSVHCDKDFLAAEPWKKVLDHLHYRILDVSSIKEAARRWAGEELLRGLPPKKGLHQAREDVLESIEEAKYYMEAFFQPAQALKGVGETGGEGTGQGQGQGQ